MEYAGKAALYIMKIKLKNKATYKVHKALFLTHTRSKLSSRSLCDDGNLLLHCPLATCDHQSLITKLTLETGEMVWWLRTLAAHAKDLVSIPSYVEVRN